MEEENEELLDEPTYLEKPEDFGNWDKLISLVLFGQM